MGINGLLPLLTKIQKKVNLKDFAGKRVAVDGNVWLHRGAFSCALELALNKPTTAYINYFMHQVNLLRHHGVDPVIVFDGDPLPIKKHTNDLRRKRREAAYDEALDQHRLGKLQSAKENLQKTIQITPHIVNEVIKVLKLNNVKYIHAPYEADPQLTYLCKNGMVSAVLTEDSDLLVYGCPTVLFKLDYNGDVIQIHHQDLFSNLCNGFDFSSWDTTKFRHMCMISGCDYLPSINGVGLKTAYSLLAKYGTIDKAMPYLLSLSPNGSSYNIEFQKANDTFLHQFVYCPRSKTCIPMTTLPANKSIADYGFLGVSPDTKKQTLKPTAHQPLGGKCNMIRERTKLGSLTSNHIEKYPGKENIPPSSGGLDNNPVGLLTSTDSSRTISRPSAFIASREFPVAFTRNLGKRKVSRNEYVDNDTNTNARQRTSLAQPQHRPRSMGLSPPSITSNASNTSTTIETRICYVTKWGRTSREYASRQPLTLEPTNRLLAGRPRNPS